MKVQIIKTAFFDGSLVHPGAVLEVPEGTKGSWFRVITEDAPAEPAKKPARKQETKALSELGRGKPQTMIDLMSQPAEGDDIA
jgi:alkylated DNA nucleotide flippase Atl1